MVDKNRRPPWTSETRLRCSVRSCCWSSYWVQAHTACPGLINMARPLPEPARILASSPLQSSHAIAFARAFDAAAECAPPAAPQKGDLERMHFRKIPEFDPMRLLSADRPLLRGNFVCEIGHQSKQTGLLERIVAGQPRRHLARSFDGAIGPFVQICF